MFGYSAHEGLHLRCLNPTLYIERKRSHCIRLAVRYTALTHPTRSAIALKEVYMNF